MKYIHVSNRSYLASMWLLKRRRNVAEAKISATYFWKLWLKDGEINLLKETRLYNTAAALSEMKSAEERKLAVSLASAIERRNEESNRGWNARESGWKLISAEINQLEKEVNTKRICIENSKAGRGEISGTKRRRSWLMKIGWRNIVSRRKESLLWRLCIISIQCSNVCGWNDGISNMATVTESKCGYESQ